MHRDQKIGLSLGVLLVGFAAAFCFRNEPLSDLHPLAVEQATALDSRIEQLPVRAYTQREGVGEPPRLPDLLKSADDVVDASFVDPPIQPITFNDAAGGDVLELFPGPPEPMSSTVPETVPAAHAALPARRTAAAQPAEAAAEPLAAAEQDIDESPPSVAPEAPAGAGRTYVVKSGDTLSGVSVQMYGTVGRYLEIFQVNREVLRDPDDLPVGTTLRIP